LSGLTNVGAGNVTVTPGATGYTVTFGGTLNAAVQPAISISDPGDADTYTPQYANAALTSAGPAPYNGSKGNWRFDRIVFHGEAITTTTLTDNGPNPATTAQAINFTATVTGGAPAGETVSLEDASNGNMVVATAMLNAGGVATITVSAGTLSAGTHNLFAVFASDGNYLASQSSPTIPQVVNSVTGIAPTLASSQVGDGTAQRSTIDGVTVVFSEAVNLNALSFTLSFETAADNLNLQNGQVTSATYTALSNTNDLTFASSDGGITWVISCKAGGAADRLGAGDTTGDLAGHGIFADGVYKLTLHGAHLADAATGTANFNNSMDSTVQFADGGGTLHNSFAALYGDLGGTGIVNSNDSKKMGTALGKNLGDTGYLAALDFSGTNSGINANDSKKLGKNLGIQLLLP